MLRTFYEYAVASAILYAGKRDTFETSGSGQGFNSQPEHLYPEKFPRLDPPPPPPWIQDRQPQGAVLSYLRP